MDQKDDNILIDALKLKIQAMESALSATILEVACYEAIMGKLPDTYVQATYDRLTQQQAEINIPDAVLAAREVWEELGLYKQAGKWRAARHSTDSESDAVLVKLLCVSDKPDRLQ